MSKLTPKQKKVAAGVAIGGVLALFVLISRRGSSQVQDATANTPTGTGLPQDYAGAATGTFADNGASAGQLSTAVTDLTGQFTSALDAQNDAITGALSTAQQNQVNANAGFQAQIDSFGQTLAGIMGSLGAPGPAGSTGTPQQTQAAPAAKSAALASSKPAATSSGPQKAGNSPSQDTVKIASGAVVKIGSIVQKPSAEHGGKLWNYRVNSNGTLAPQGAASGH